MRSRRPRVAIVLQLALIAGVVAASIGAIQAASQSPSAARRFASILEHVSRVFVDSIPAESLYVKAARGLVEQLRDPYAALYSPADLARFRRQTIGEAYGGVGMEVTPQRGGVRVTRVFRQTPAAAMGIEVGDRVVEIDGSSVRELEMEEVTRRLLGRPGSEIRIAVERIGTGDPIRVSGRRAVVHVPAVPAIALLESGIGYIPLQHFSGTATQEVAEAARDLRSRGASRLILDLRGNGGGDLNAAIGVSSVFLPSGATVVSIRYRGEPDDLVRAPQLPNVARDTTAPLVVLVDDGSASASEIVAGALQDHDRALIVGTTSFGKGLVQGLYPLEGGWALKMTTGKWYTPSGRLIQRDRQLDDNGRLVEVAPDSIETDSVRATRPTFRSDRGRVVYGGGGITPDVIVSADTLSAVEQRLVRSLAPSWSTFGGAVERTALELRSVTRSAGNADVRSSAVWRDQLYQRLTSDSVRVSRALYDSATSFVDRWLERRVVTLSFGDSAWVRRSSTQDQQVRRAVELLRRVATATELVMGGGRRSPPA
jgi:carboxyl-terminal processing protease